MFLKKMFNSEPELLPTWLIIRPINTDNGYMVKGKIMQQFEDGLRIDYTDNTNQTQSIIAHKKDFVCINPSDKIPIFCHNNSDLFVCNTRLDKVVGSRYFHKILNENFGGGMVDALEPYNKPTNIPWKIILIAGGIIVGLIILWQTGILPDLFNSLTNSININPGEPKYIP